MSVSPSQCVTIERCPRRWWFEKVARLRVPDSKPQHFGHALHKVCAAHLGSQPLPSTWADDLTNDEVERVLDFRDRAIKKGILRAREGLKIEHDFHMAIGERDMHGVIDCLDLGTEPASRDALIVEDHKAISSRKWGKTEADLIVDIPMMIYAGYAFTIATQDRAVLRHNQFIQDEMEVRPVEAVVTKEQVRRFWGSRVMPLLRKMDGAMIVEQWDQVEGRKRKSEACSAYGGCPFAVICHNGMPIEDFASPPPETNGVPF